MGWHHEDMDRVRERVACSSDPEVVKPRYGARIEKIV